ncbi:unnamed protein product [Nezara viridula]|uniref:Uncharacterized protein n=1 Tax=Nezara viridula TaxID=85310 RepID=A0A9P0HIJ7_NEZVI|nr:unnamed protein product [Nezara viridula]
MRYTNIEKPDKEIARSRMDLAMTSASPRRNASPSLCETQRFIESGSTVIPLYGASPRGILEQDDGKQPYKD